MSNFLKKQNSNPILNPLISLSDNHKESIVSLFIILAGSDQHLTGGITKKEFAFLDKHAEIFNLKNEFTILEKSGIDGILKYLNDLNLAQRESLIILTWNLLESDEEPNDVEILDMNKILDKMGISTQQIVQTLRQKN
jgi:hypothetical protein